MVRIVFKYVGVFLGLIFLQVLILNNLHLSIYVNPYVYILLILLLPFEIPGWILLSAAFVTGMTMDGFSNTMGMHTAATVLMAFLRRYLTRLIAPREGYESGQTPHYNYMGMIWFLSYASILTTIHHLALFLIEDFEIAHFFTVFFKAIISSILSIVVMVVLMLFTYKPK